MKLADFRQRLLAALREAKARTLSAQPLQQPLQQLLQHLHLLYAPELSDPLRLVGDSKRDTAVLRPPSGEARWPREACPMLVTLDCRRVAAYLLETDPGFDDPLLEASITQAHAQVDGQRVRTEITNDDPGMAEAAVCGWIVSPESAGSLASRINRHAALFNSQNRQRWVRWYHPACIGMLWPTMGLAQRQALLGQGAWFAHDAVGRLQGFSAESPASADRQPEPAQGTRYLSVAQWGVVDNVQWVTELVRQWHALCVADGRALPHDADRRLNAHVSAARAHGLDAEDLVIYALLAVQLLDGAMRSPAVLRVVAQAREHGLSLRDGVRGLPDSFWICHLPMNVTPEQALLAAIPKLA